MHIKKLFHSLRSFLPCVGMISILFMDVKRIASFLSCNKKKTPKNQTEIRAGLS